MLELWIFKLKREFFVLCLCIAGYLDRAVDGEESLSGAGSEWRSRLVLKVLEITWHV